MRLHDEYLDYIGESPWSWPVEALKAQAAAARGYALRKYDAGDPLGLRLPRLRHDERPGLRRLPTVVSNGNLPYWADWKTRCAPPAPRDAPATSSRYAGDVIQAFYSSSLGGRTENNEDVWGGTPLPYLRGVADPWSLRTSNPAVLAAG